MAAGLPNTFGTEQEIVDNGYDLSINKYKQVEYVAVKYPPTSEIMAELKELEGQIAVEMAELERLLEGGENRWLMKNNAL